MNSVQIIYAAALAAVFATRGPSAAAWGLLANMAATIAACLAMDLGALDRGNATIAIMLIDFATGAALMMRPGVARIIAAGYAVTVPIYSMTVIFGVQTGTTFAIVNAIAFIQLAVVYIGNGSDDLGNRDRRASLADHLASSFRSDPVGKGGMAQSHGLLSVDSRGVE